MAAIEISVPQHTHNCKCLLQMSTAMITKGRALTLENGSLVKGSAEMNICLPRAAGLMCVGDLRRSDGKSINSPQAPIQVLFTLAASCSP